MSVASATHGPLLPSSALPSTRIQVSTESEKNLLVSCLHLFLAFVDDCHTQDSSLGLFSNAQNTLITGGTFYVCLSCQCTNNLAINVYLIYQNNILPLNTREEQMKISVPQKPNISESTDEGLNQTRTEEDPQEEKLNLLTPSTIVEGVELPEPQPRNISIPFSTALLNGNQPTPELKPELESTTNMDKSNLNSNPTVATNGTKDIKSNLPKPFDGTREKFQKFLQDSEIHLGINHKMYDTDLARIGFILSFMTEGHAEAWAYQFVEEAKNQNNGPTLDLGRYEDFRKILKETFSAYDSPGDALHHMKMIRMKPEDNIDGHVAKFATLVSASQLDPDSAAVIGLFQETLPLQLQRKILTLENPPTTMKDWYKWAQQIDHAHKRTRAIIERSWENLEKKNPNPQYYSPQRGCNPNAMDVDALALNERRRLMKEGRCFQCRKIGHIALNCPNKDGQRKEEPKHEEKKKMNGKQLHAHIKSLFKEMTEEDREEFIKKAEEMGF